MTKNFSKIFSTLIILFLSGALQAQKAGHSKQQYKVAVIDLMILKRQKLGAFQLTKEIGADGVEVDMGGLGNRPTFDNKLLIFIDFRSKQCPL